MGAHEITQRLLLRARYPDRVQLPSQEQPDQKLSITPVGLDPITRRPRDLARRRHNALHASHRELARHPIPGQARLTRDTHRPRQPRAEPGRLTSITVHPERPQLTAPGVEHSRDVFVACTSEPTRDLAFAIAGSSYSVVDRPRGGYRAA
jgi:hypothetical protein